ncbi:uncharacterized protein Z519_07198 [Cladophialophora bantiana CBS 173.52]|uniref:RRM domain-containing protein n=1 Tax=Cladophialophora bantiana (strain ATCC 10958 / CBS 173.52 / CDC B-1940 / NIH 8579) TaxID=1442370 RepID=A0A0D2I5N9_CLAB1|nr:uncharacterized protein Z519_07198 [Cladophialophora bantiana CBS 173.52]KIW92214.1 hypothetical protein Z519_07198 [Cladophialophora bantiana CBS 173.52]
MSNPKVATDFDAIIQADRQRKKNEALANEIFGRNKANKSTPRSTSKGSSRTPDLASRITKRSSSVASTGSSRNNLFSTLSRPSSATPQNARSSRLASALESSQANIISSQQKPRGPGLSIKGKAGPFVVEASNFAPGTTAADIESALQGETVDENGVSGMLSCRLVKTSPVVVAELVFTEKQMAEQIISTYHNQKADGRILRLSLKRTGPGSISTSQSNQPDTSSAPEAVEPEPQPQPSNESTMEDVEMETEGVASHDNRRSREPRNAEADVQDGRYGFEEPQTSDTHARHADRRGEDDRRDRDRNYDRDHDHDQERERERERDRDRDRERDRDRDRDRYDRRDSRPAGPSSYRRGDRPDTYNSRPSHYGNGVGGTPGPGRGMFGGGVQGPFPRGGGRMYSDDMMRGGRRGGGPGGFGPGGYPRRGGY